MNEEKGKDSLDLEKGGKRISHNNIGGRNEKKVHEKRSRIDSLQKGKRKNEKRRNNKRGKKGVPAKVANPDPERIRIYSALVDPDPQ